MRSNAYRVMRCATAAIVLMASMAFGKYGTLMASDKPRVIVTSDGEIDDECSMVRFLLYANEWDIEGIVTSSSQYHWQGHKWAGDDWVQPYLDRLCAGLPKLDEARSGIIRRLSIFRSRTALGNVKSEGDMDEETAGSQLIVKGIAGRDR